MRYIDMKWDEPDPEVPIRVYSEIDDDGWERRKVERFKDNTLHRASETESTTRTELSYTPIPSNAEILANPELMKNPAFELCEMTAEEFEAIWSLAGRDR